MFFEGKDSGFRQQFNLNRTKYSVDEVGTIKYNLDTENKGVYAMTHIITEKEASSAVYAHLAQSAADVEHGRI